MKKRGAAADDLRRDAEARLESGRPAAADDADARKLLHELQVHQIELEMQNAELRQAWHDVDAARARYRDLYDFAPVGYVSLERGDVIGEINLAGATLLGGEPARLAGKRFGAFVDAGSLADFEGMLAAARAAGEKAVCEVALRFIDGRRCFVHLEALADAGSATCRAAIIDVTPIRAAEADLEHERQIAELSRHLVAAQEAERRRLSSGLFDRAIPNLAAIQLSVRAFADAVREQLTPHAANLLEDIHALLDDTATGIRETCADLHPTVLDYAGLLPALESYARQFMNRTGIAVRLRKKGRRRQRLVADRESALFRIAQEAMTNCANHAAAGQIEIELSTIGRKVTLSIADDGIGFDPASGWAPAQGLQVMRERAEFAGGKFSVASHPSGGTRIAVEFEDMDG